jgi:hypothetical protein
LTSEPASSPRGWAALGPHGHPGPPSSWAFEASPLGAAGSTTTTERSCASGPGQPPAASDPGQGGLSLVGQQPSAAGASARAGPGPGPRPRLAASPTDRPTTSAASPTSQAPTAVDGAARVRGKPRRTQPTPAVQVLPDRRSQGHGGLTGDGTDAAGRTGGH